MKIKLIIATCTIFVTLLSCKESESKVDIPSPKKSAFIADTIKLSKEEYYDKVLGALVGSAIGDAMGASTEMWHRNEIQLKYGYINGLTAATREQSPEGTWDHNLLAGATTDDTRWKYFMVNYFSSNKVKLSPEQFSKFITDYYASLTKELGGDAIAKNPDLLDNQIEKVDWIKEWARVALAYQNNGKAYQKALNRFYGGEMSCAGQLYTPMFGLIANNPEEAYSTAYEHSIFDIGYAKDISGLVAAMTQTAMQTKNIDSILNTAIFVDPLGYKSSRLVMRISQNVLDAARRTVLVSRNLSLEKDSLVTAVPKGYTHTEQDWLQQDYLYTYLDNDKKAIAFHAGEIWQITVTAIAFGQGDFEKTMQFIVNYGRDNDTVAAVAGMILGAKDGYSNLPTPLKTTILKVSKENMGIDLEAMAHEMTTSFYQ
ncbi:ADP-ribosylglycohydrolase family protein [Aurantibacter crassamenti]|uniref:ADP-ribosylglycohydrolase family protein n=1 Tax=Aurantibacter crassamenti TaxID=1837375 RepID=UPI00193AA296|nr:ADP-ribosylglycohydrolase family protein [Aurantibacter crassamenti]MBM1104703.1 ADP-ribosylglycohydrolase family protein [Aurantibacter crassamenti]